MYQAELLYQLFHQLISELSWLICACSEEICEFRSFDRSLGGGDLRPARPGSSWRPRPARTWMPDRVEAICASMADSEFCAPVTCACAFAICRCASACLLARSRPRRGGQRVQPVHLRLGVADVPLRASDLRGGLGRRLLQDAGRPAGQVGQEVLRHLGVHVEPVGGLQAAPFAVTAASKTPKTFPAQPKSKPWSDSVTCAAAVSAEQ